MTMTKQYLRASLNMGMHGTQQMPALYFKMSFVSPDQVNLSRYKILINEPLHDISNHTKNIQEELSHHVPKENKIHVKNLLLHHSVEKRHKIQQITEKAC